MVTKTFGTFSNHFASGQVTSPNVRWLCSASRWPETTNQRMRRAPAGYCSAYAAEAATAKPLVCWQACEFALRATDTTFVKRFALFFGWLPAETRQTAALPHAG
ncbi:hypothetical protein NPIL_317471 [Nephila pilipes]|uniref:Uncharacterized protein n=1 Tax=Nephila pilipes TaxID=299642 RepID=A0A8X6KNX5_NEPPI|nr:hypothetical protein NPIL_317471 [Nephila pilipes]